MLSWSISAAAAAAAAAAPAVAAAAAESTVAARTIPLIRRARKRGCATGRELQRGGEC